MYTKGQWFIGDLSRDRDNDGHHFFLFSSPSALLTWWRQAPFLNPQSIPNPVFLWGPTPPDLAHRLIPPPWLLHHQILKVQKVNARPPGYMHIDIHVPGGQRGLAFLGPQS